MIGIHEIGKRVICRSLQHDYAPLFKRTYKASEVHEIEDDNMSITRSISVVQTDNRVLKAGSLMSITPY